MMTVLMFLIFMLAHLSGDFVLQTDAIAQAKGTLFHKVDDARDNHQDTSTRGRTKAMRALEIHVLHHLVLTVVAAIILAEAQHRYFWLILWAPVITGFSHFVIDLTKAWVGRMLPANNGRVPQLLLFMVDQFLHIAVVALITRLYSVSAYQSLLNALYSVVWGTPVHLSTTERVVAIAIIFICSTAVSGTIVQLIAIPPRAYELNEEIGAGENVRDSFGEHSIADSQDTSNESSRTAISTESGSSSSSTVHAGSETEIAASYQSVVNSRLIHTSSLMRRGRMIGYLERLILVFIISMGAYAAITFIVAAKSLIRLKKFDSPAFAEYFLIGTLTSMLCGTVFGLALKYILS